ncbi:MAG: DUF362 domain-containing protein [Phycisphaerales bacterium]|nr:MAG: DUF362 domain-containing protein [Phycisphaerales bacterium]
MSGREHQLDAGEPAIDLAFARGGCSRRSFLRVGGALAGACLWGKAHGEDKTPPLRIPLGTPASKVARLHSPHVVRGPTLQARHLREMLAQTLEMLTGKSSTAEAWVEILDHGQVVGLKFNRSGQAALGTSPALAEALIESLLEAGWAPHDIICIEAPPSVEAYYCTKRADPGYDREVTDFGSGSDRLATVLNQVDALINIPFLKAHNIAGFTSCLKNLSYGLIKHPARFHANGCHPFIADICALPAIRGKLKLCLVDALRMVFDRGPEPQSDTVFPAGTLIAGFDPVALDAAGLIFVNELRAGKGLAPLNKLPIGSGGMPYLARAHRLGLGIALPQGLQLIEKSL